MQKEIPAGKMTVRDREYDVKLIVNVLAKKQTARFMIEGLTVGRYPRPVASETWEGLYAAAMAATKAKRVRIAMPVLKLDSRRCRDLSGYESFFRPGTIIGRHASNGNLLVKWEGEPSPEQMSMGYGQDKLFRPMSDDRQREYLALVEQQRKAEKAVEAFEERFVIHDVVAEVDTEIERVAADLPDDER